jgi:Holliday junction resolvasome RuvABC endonuclease subunit
MDLSKFRVDEESNLAIIEAEPGVLFDGTILAFDQSLAATGWAHLQCRNGEIAVREVGMLPTSPSDRGHEGSLRRAVLIHQQALALIAGVHPDRIAHEAPAVGGRMARPEASLVAATAIRIAASMYAIPVFMYGAQKVKKRLTGNGNAQKKELRGPLDRMFPIIVEMKPRNDNTYDAVGVGVVCAEES